MGTDTRIEYYRSKVKQQLAGIADYMGKRRYEFYLQMIDMTDDYEELRELAEVELQLNMVDYIQKEIQNPLENAHTNIRDLNMALDSEYRAIAEKQNQKAEQQGVKVDELELEESIEEQLNDDSMQSMLAYNMMCRIHQAQETEADRAVAESYIEDDTLDFDVPEEELEDELFGDSLDEVSDDTLDDTEDTEAELGEYLGEDSDDPGEEPKDLGDGLDDPDEEDFADLFGSDTPDDKGDEEGFDELLGEEDDSDFASDGVPAPEESGKPQSGLFEEQDEEADFDNYDGGYLEDTPLDGSLEGTEDDTDEDEDEDEDELEADLFGDAAEDDEEDLEEDLFGDEGEDDYSLNLDYSDFIEGEPSGESERFLGELRGESYTDEDAEDEEGEELFDDSYSDEEDVEGDDEESLFADFEDEEDGEEDDEDSLFADFEDREEDDEDEFSELFGDSDDADGPQEDLGDEQGLNRDTEIDELDDFFGSDYPDDTANNGRDAQIDEEDDLEDLFQDDGEDDLEDLFQDDGKDEFEQPPSKGAVSSGSSDSRKALSTPTPAPAKPVRTQNPTHSMNGLFMNGSDRGAKTQATIDSLFRIGTGAQKGLDAMRKLTSKSAQKGISKFSKAAELELKSAQSDDDEIIDF